MLEKGRTPGGRGGAWRRGRAKLWGKSKESRGQSPGTRVGPGEEPGAEILFGGVVREESVGVA